MESWKTEKFTSKTWSHARSVLLEAISVLGGELPSPPTEQSEGWDVEMTESSFRVLWRFFRIQTNKASKKADKDAAIKKREAMIFFLRSRGVCAVQENNGLRIRLGLQEIADLGTPRSLYPRTTAGH